MFFHDFFHDPHDQNHMLVPKPQSTYLSDLECRALSWPKKHWEKATTFKRSTNFWHYLVMSNLSRIFFQFFGPFSEDLNFSENYDFIFAVIVASLIYQLYYFGDSFQLWITSLIELSLILEILYCTLDIITCSWFETTFDYKLQI